MQRLLAAVATPPRSSRCPPERRFSLLVKSAAAAAARDQLPLCLEPLKMGVLIRDTTGSTQHPAKQSKMTPCGVVLVAVANEGG